MMPGDWRGAEPCHRHGRSGPQEGRVLAQKGDGWSNMGNPLEWAGFFLFAVGVYGTMYRTVTRHLTLWGVIPLDWVYLALLLGGASLLLLYSRSSPFFFDTSEKSAQVPWWKLAFRGLRAIVCLALLGFALYFALFR